MGNVALQVRLVSVEMMEEIFRVALLSQIKPGNGHYVFVLFCFFVCLLISSPLCQFGL